MKFFLKNQGVITAFVTMIMVPVVVFTGIFVDMSRFKFCSSQAIMAADAYAEGILGTYDNVLKELYGLFSVSQSEEGKAAIEDIADYVGYSFNPAGDEDFDVEGSMPYATVDVELEYKPIEGATLKDSSVFLTQVSDFMQYRIVGEMVKDSSILDAFGRIQNVGNDSEAMEKVTEIGKSSTKALEYIQTYFENLHKVAQYPEYKEKMEGKYDSYRYLLVSIINSEEYRKYYEYEQYYDEIQQAIENREAYELYKNAYPDNNNGEVCPYSLEDLYPGTEAYLAREFDYTLINDIKSAIAEEKEDVHDMTGDPIDFENTPDFIDALNDYAGKIDDSLIEIQEKLNELNAQLNSGECSEDVAKGIKEDIKDLETITEMSGEFSYTYSYIEEIHSNKDKNTQNALTYIDQVRLLNTVESQLENRDIVPKNTTGNNWNHTISLLWNDFKDDTRANDLYVQLKEICGTEETGEGDKNAGDKKVEAAEEYSRQAKESLENDDEMPPRNIGDLASQLKGKSDGNEPELGFIGVSTLSEGLNMVIDKFLLTSYNFGMFSSRVTGIEVKEDDTDNSPGEGENPVTEVVENVTEEVSGEDSQESDSEEEYADYSLTKVKMSPDVNYLYRAELEYLFGGNTDSKKNWNAARNTICSVRMAFNFASTYSITKINVAINKVANMAAEAVAASGVGLAVAPLVRVAVSAAIRAAIAGMETAAEWAQLKDRESVLLYKKEIGDFEIVKQLDDIIGGEESVLGEEKKSEGIELSYEDYLYLLMLLVVKTDTLTDRTADLITLNVNQSQNDGDTLTNLDFNMADTVTAVESTCKIKMDFVVVPDNFAKMFISGTTTETTIKSLEERYTGFSLIRGY